MKQLSLSGVLQWGLAFVLLGVVLHAPISVGFGTVLPDAALVIKAWKEILLALLGAVAAIAVTRRGMWRELLQDRVIQLGLAFIGLHLLLAAVMGGDVESIAAGLLIDLRFVAICLLAYIAVQLRPGLRNLLVRATVVGAVIVIGFGLLQITVLPDDVLRGLGYSKQTITPYTTIDSNPDYVRINSTLRGPNPLGALVVVYLALALAYLARRHTKASVALKVVGLGSIVGAIMVLFASYSRSAYLAAVATVGAIAVLTVRLSKPIIAGIFGLIAIGGLGLAMVSTSDWFSNVILHEDPESSTVAKSNDDHVTSLATGFERTLTQPFGAGVGSTGSASLYDDESSNDIVIENQYFFVAHEAGWLGLILYIALFVVIMLRLWQARSDWLALGLFASGIGLASIGLLLPVWVDETVAITWWALVGASVAIHKRYNREYNE